MMMNYPKIVLLLVSFVVATNAYAANPFSELGKHWIDGMKEGLRTVKTDASKEINKPMHNRITEAAKEFALEKSVHEIVIDQLRTLAEATIKAKAATEFLDSRISQIDEKQQILIRNLLDSKMRDIYVRQAQAEPNAICSPADFPIKTAHNMRDNVYSTLLSLVFSPELKAIAKIGDLFKFVAAKLTISTLNKIAHSAVTVAEITHDENFCSPLNTAMLIISDKEIDDLLDETLPKSHMSHFHLMRSNIFQ